MNEKRIGVRHDSYDTEIHGFKPFIGFRLIESPHIEIVIGETVGDKQYGVRVRYIAKYCRDNYLEEYWIPKTARAFNEETERLLAKYKDDEPIVVDETRLGDMK
ncbi:MAG: hypothetical protein WC888_06420 [Candidatus Izemoplasmatales bacterium]|jgi:hypothetical protein